MALSMTSFGQGSAQEGDWQCDVRVKSVNSRYLEIHFQHGKVFDPMQGEFRHRVAEHIFRGKVHVQIDLVRGDRPGMNLSLDEAVFRSYAQDLARLSACPGDDLPVEAYLALLKMPGVYRNQEDHIDGKAFVPPVMAALNQALLAHRQGAQREGAILLQAMDADLRAFAGVLDSLEGHLPQLEQAYRQRLRRRLEKELDRGDWDANRVLQEIALFVDKTDVTEEVVRLRSHLQGLDELLQAADDKPLGKEVDFFLQEMHREVNTIGSKIQDPDVTPLVVEMKKRIEQCREQVQNLA